MKISRDDAKVLKGIGGKSSDMGSSWIPIPFLKCWSRTYLGPRGHLRIYQGSQFVSAEFLSNSEADGISVLQAPIESPTTMGHVERYRAPLRVAFLKYGILYPEAKLMLNDYKWELKPSTIPWDLKDFVQRSWCLALFLGLLESFLRKK